MPEPRIRGGVSAPIAHDSAHKHVTGEALYTDDLPEPPGTLQSYILMSSRAHARIVRIDTAAAAAMPGVAAIVTAEDIPGRNDVGPIFDGEPILAPGVVEYIGMPVAAVAATTVKQARAAAALIAVDYEDRPAVLSIEEALAARSFVCPPHEMRRGDAARGLARAPHRIISFTTQFLNQAGALVHVYTDGSVHLNHGGTEMGQGLMIKVAQVVAEEFQIDIDRVKVTATNTGKVPNTSATAASSGSDLNGMAAQAAAREIKNRLIGFASAQFKVPPGSVRFIANRVWAGGQSLEFGELATLAHKARVQLSATGFYKTPLIHYDREKGRGRPFLYFAYGIAAAEVLVDTLTGEYKVLRADLLHDVGRSLNPAIDLGQIEGGFIQGMGWLTTEELWWDKSGALKTHAPSTYKIPGARDLPQDFRVRLYERSENRAETIHRSKAVGEPPLMLANAVWLALKDAVAAAADHRALPRLDAPATPERVLMAIEDVRGRTAAATPQPLAGVAE